MSGAAGAKSCSHIGTKRGRVVDIDSADVNEYLSRATGDHFTAKDFRTWAGTVLAATALRELEQFDSEAQAKRNVVKAVEAVAMRLGNTKTVCRKCYIHPRVIETYLDGTLAKTVEPESWERTERGRSQAASGGSGDIGVAAQHRLMHRKRA